MKYNNKSF
jgi:GH24 family phage-related lysozyme (muramidase)